MRAESLKEVQFFLHAALLNMNLVMYRHAHEKKIMGLPQMYILTLSTKFNFTEFLYNW